MIRLDRQLPGNDNHSRTTPKTNGAHGDTSGRSFSQSGKSGFLSSPDIASLIHLFEQIIKLLFKQPPPQDDPPFTTLALGEEGGEPQPPKGENPPKPKPIDPPDVTTLAVGEEGGVSEPPIGENPKPKPRPIGPPDVTTLAVGEEGGDLPFPPTTPPVEPPGGGEPVVKPHPIKPPIATTQAIGEEGGDVPFPPTTPPVEPSDGGEPVVRPHPIKPPIATTHAVGEEGGDFPPITSPLPRPIGPPDATTLAIGEEDGGSVGQPPVSERPMPVEPPGFETGGKTPPDDSQDSPVDNVKPPTRYLGPPDATTLAVGEEDGAL